MQPSSTINPGLCADCVHAHVIRSDRGSVFYRCERSFTDPSFPKYPRLPVLECRGHEPTQRPPLLDVYTADK